MSEHTRTVRLTIDVAYHCGPLGFTGTDKHRLLAAVRGGLDRAGVVNRVLAANAVVIDLERFEMCPSCGFHHHKTDKEPTT